jgi:hypothetical protein
MSVVTDIGSISWMSFGNKLNDTLTQVLIDRGRFSIQFQNLNFSNFQFKNLALFNLQLASAETEISKN